MKLIKLDDKVFPNLFKRYEYKNCISYGFIDNFNNLSDYIIFAKSFDRNYQYEIVDFKYNNQENFLKIWMNFCNKYKPNSVFVKTEFKNNIFLNIEGFKNLVSKDIKGETYYIGEYNNTDYKLSKSSIEKYGLGNLIDLNDYSYEFYNYKEILHELKFSIIKEENSYNQVDYYFRFGKIYQINDLDDNTFYIGSTTNKANWSKYKGSGKKWKEHIKNFPPIDEEPFNQNSHHYEKIELKDINDFKNPKDFYEYEKTKIKECINNPLCLNTNIQRNAAVYVDFDKVKKCPICNSKFVHKKWCLNNKTEIKEGCTCNARPGQFHKKDCPLYIDPGKCPECGYSLQSRKHDKNCSHYKKPNESEYCPECLSRYGHTKDCSRGLGYFSCCGNSMQSRHHAPYCENYKGNKIVLCVCTECKGINDHHKPGCSHHGTCTICDFRYKKGSRHRDKCEFNIMIKVLQKCKDESKKFSNIEKILNNSNKIFKENNIDIELTESDLIMYKII